MLETLRGKRDALTRLIVHVMMCDAIIAVPGNYAYCIVAVAAKREHDFVEFIVYRTIAYGRKANSKHWTRWRVSRSILEVVKQFDVSKEVAISMMPKEGLTLIFNPPDKAHTLKYLKSKRRRAKANTSARNGNRQKRTSYRIPDPLTLQGVRWGTKLKT